MERTEESNQTPAGITAAMNDASHAKVKSFRSEFDKLTSVANPKNGPKFLEAVSLSMFFSYNFYTIYIDIDMAISMITDHFSLQSNGKA